MRSLLLQSAPSRSPTLQGGGLRLLAASATQALVARMSSPPPASRVDAIFALILALMDAGVWSRLDLLHMLAAHDIQAAQLNWVSPAYDIGRYNSPLFAANRGFQGAGTAYLEAAGYNPSAGGTKYTLNDAAMGAWVLTPCTVSGIDVFMGNGRLSRRDTTGDDYHYRVNDGTSYYGPGALTGGFFAADRPDSATKRRFKNGALGGFSATAATANAAYLRLLSTGSGSYSDASIAAVFAGGSLTEAQHAALYAAIRTYLLAVGAIVA